MSRTISVFALLLLVSCAHQATWVATGESVDALGQAFLTTGRALDEAYDKHQVSEAQYAKWRAFSKYFKPVYDEASDRWLHYDDSAAAHAGAVLAALSAELAEFALPPKGAP